MSVRCDRQDCVWQYGGDWPYGKCARDDEYDQPNIGADGCRTFEKRTVKI